MATLYGSPVVVVPILVQELEEPSVRIDDEPMYALNDNSGMIDDTKTSFNVKKRSAEETGDDDLETAAGTNVMRPLFVYRQQVAYRQRVRDAIRRGRRI